jgi:site-specific DNA recombinase
VPIEAEGINAEYDRISRDKRGAAEGVETQQVENADAAEELGLTIQARYVDNDLSAYSGVERPDYERLLADIAAGKISTLIIWHANRLHRSTEEVNAFIKLARAHKLRLYSTTKGAFYNLDKASGRKELRDDTSEAEYESEHRGERVAIARKRQARHGVYGGGVRPFGVRQPEGPGDGAGLGGPAGAGHDPPQPGRGGRDPQVGR